MGAKVSGFITMHREALDHPLFKDDPARLGAWVWMIAKAAWRPTRFDVGGKIVTLQRGQLCVSVRHLAEAWGWSKSAVDRFLTRLKTETMIGTEAGTGRLIITICNYDKYQTQNEGAGTPSGTATGTAAGQQRDIKEQGNKLTREEKGESNDSPKKVRAEKSDGVSAQVRKPDGVSAQVWADFTAHRKRKKADITPTALKLIVSEAAKAGWSLESALSEIVTRGWTGFKAAWIGEKNANSNRPPVDNRDGFARALDREIERNRRATGSA